MMRKVLPHEFFRVDFDAVLEGALRQEQIDPGNKGEYDIAKGMHDYFVSISLPLIVDNDWVYESALTFISDYAIDCLQCIKLGGAEVFNVQRKQLENKQRIMDLLKLCIKSGVVKYRKKTINLVKSSDFYGRLDHKKMTLSMRRKAESLYEEAKETELLLLKVILRATRDLYETVLPRLLYLLRRVIKVEFGLSSKPSDEKLLGVSESISFYNHYIHRNHPLYPVLGYLDTYYRPARNVGNHHLGLKWESDVNEVVLQDPSESQLRVSLLEFQQRYRYFVYFSDFGTRGISSAFCEREKGPLSNSLVKQYVKTFPEDFPVDDPYGVVIPYTS